MLSSSTPSPPPTPSPNELLIYEQCSTTMTSACYTRVLYSRTSNLYAMMIAIVTASWLYWGAVGDRLSNVHFFSKRLFHRAICMSLLRWNNFYVELNLSYCVADRFPHARYYILFHIWLCATFLFASLLQFILFFCVFMILVTIKIFRYLFSLCLSNIGVSNVCTCGKLLNNKRNKDK